VTKKMKRAANTIDKFRSVYHIKTVLRKTTWYYLGMCNKFPYRIRNKKNP
jgi:hypothetical protein